MQSIPDGPWSITAFPWLCLEGSRAETGAVNHSTGSLEGGDGGEVLWSVPWPFPGSTPRAGLEVAPPHHLCLSVPRQHYTKEQGAICTKLVKPKPKTGMKSAEKELAKGRGWQQGVGVWVLGTRQHDGGGHC